MQLDIITVRARQVNKKNKKKVGGITSESFY